MLKKFIFKKNKINRAMCYSKLWTDDQGFSEKSSEGNLFLKTHPQCKKGKAICQEHTLWNRRAIKNNAPD